MKDYLKVKVQKLNYLRDVFLGKAEYSSGHETCWLKVASSRALSRRDEGALGKVCVNIGEFLGRQ